MADFPYVQLFVARAEGDMVTVAGNVDPARLNILVALATLPGLAFDVTVSKIAMHPIPMEDISEAEGIALEALYAAIKDYFPVAG